MKTRAIALTLMVCVLALATSFAKDHPMNPQMGTWKLNEAKSKLPAGATKNVTVIYTAVGDMTKVTTDGFTGDGKPSHTEWTGKFDGKDYPLTGDPTADTRSYVKVNQYTLTLENKKAGKVTTSAKVVVAADGKTRILTGSGMNAAGEKVTSSQFYEKQ